MFNKIHLNGCGYRLLRDFHADFRRLNVIIGANASGKSTLVDFLQLVTDLAGFGVQEVFNFHGGSFSIPNAGQVGNTQFSWDISFSKPDFNTRWHDIPISDDTIFRYRVRLGFGTAGEIAVEAEELTAENKAFGRRTMLIVDSDRSMVYNERTSELQLFDEAVPKSGVNGAQHSAPLAAPEATRGQTLRLAQMRFFNEFPVLSWARTILGNTVFYPGFDVSRNSPLRSKPSEIKAETTLAYGGENLGTVLHEILTRYDYRAKAEELKDLLRVAYPTFEDITAETGYGSPPKVLVRLRERGMFRAMELWDLSDGMLRLLCLAAALLNPLPPPVIAIDEPEAGFHPRMLPLIADLIKIASEQSQIFVTTHSPELLNQFSIDDIAVLARQDAVATWHRPASHESLRKLLEPISGDSLGDLHRSGELEAIQ